MRSYMATHNLIAVSANNKEPAINTEQTLDTTMLCALSDNINLDPRRESNADEATGKEEPDTVYDLGAVSGMPMTFNRAQAQHFAFLCAYALGAITTAAAGTGYQHTITPIDGNLDDDRSLPSFTAAQRYGKTVLKRRFTSMFVDSLTGTFEKDSWVKLSGTVKGTGKVAKNTVEETISAAKNAVVLNLTANGVEGASAAERLQNVQRIRVELTAGIWTEVAHSAVSDATPAAITISAPGATADLVNYKVLYIPIESDWMTFPARVAETPLRVAQMTLKVGGVWTGAAFSGGRELQGEMKNLVWQLNNNLQVSFVPGAGGAYASRASRDGRTQTLTLNRDFREYILQQHIDDNDTLGVYIKVEGAFYDDPHQYQAEIIFPMVAVLKSPISADGKRLAEAGDLVVLEDDTHGSVIVIVKNLQATYAA